MSFSKPAIFIIIGALFSATSCTTETKPVVPGEQTALNQSDYRNIFGYYYEKNNQVYVYADINGEYSLIQDVDIATFTPVNVNYAKDDKNVFSWGKKISGADPATFRTFDDIYEYADQYGKDDNYVYIYGEIIVGADPGSFIPLDNEFAKDDNSVYYRETILPNADPASFQVFLGENNFFAYDKNAVYYAYYVGTGNFWARTEEADRETFQVLGYYFAKDENSVYFRGQKLAEADTASFELSNNQTFNPTPQTNQTGTTFVSEAQEVIAQDKNYLYTLVNDELKKHLKN